MSEIVKKQEKRDNSALGLVIAFGAIVLFLYLLSEDAVNHPIHAIELQNGRYIHGSNLSCSEIEGAPDRYQCQTMLGDEMLKVRTSRRFASDPNGPLVCSATFGSETVGCTAAYITSSYWEQGIRLSASESLLKAAESIPRWRNWQGIFYGWYESEYGQLGAILVIFYTLFSFKVILGRRSKQPRLPLWLRFGLIGTAILFLSLFLTPRFIPPLIETEGHSYWEFWGLPLLIFIGFLASTPRWKDKTERSSFELALPMSLLISFFIYFATFAVVIVLLLSLSFID